MVMKTICVVASSNLGTRIQLALSAEIDGLRQFIVDALTNIAQYSSFSEEKFLIEHIDSISRFPDINE